MEGELGILEGRGGEVMERSEVKWLNRLRRLGFVIAGLECSCSRMCDFLRREAEKIRIMR